MRGPLGSRPSTQNRVKVADASDQQPHGVQQVVDDDRLAHVELEIAPGAGHGHGGVVGVDLDAHHDHGLALGRVDLAGHDRRPRLVLGEVELAQPGPGARPKPAEVVGDLDQRGRQRPQRPTGHDHGVVGGESGELVGGGDEGQPGELGDGRRHPGPELRMGVEPGPDGGPTGGQLVQIVQRELDAPEVGVELGDVTGELLAEGEGHGIHQVRTPDFGDGGEGFRLLVQLVPQMPDGREQ